MLQARALLVGENVLSNALEGATVQRRPERLEAAGAEVDVVVCASLVDNVPNMAGLVRTSEALLGSLEPQ